MVSVDLTIRNKKKEAKRYEAYLKKFGKRKENRRNDSRKSICGRCCKGYS